MNRETATKIRNDIAAMVSEYAEKSGLAVKPFGCSYGDDSVDMKITLIENKSGDAFKAEFEKVAHFYGLNPEHYGKMIMLSGKKYRICGIDTSARKNVVIIEDVNGKNFKTDPVTVKNSLCEG